MGVKTARGKNNEQILKQLSVCVSFIGLGSVWFHATLSFGGQFADEVSILILLFILLNRFYRWSKMVVFILVMIAFTGMCLFPWWNHLELMLLGFLTVRQFRLRLANGAPSSSAWILRLALWIFFLAVASWGIDHLCLTQRFSFHALWHVLIGITAYLGLYWLGESILPL